MRSVRGKWLVAVVAVGLIAGLALAPAFAGNDKGMAMKKPKMSTLSGKLIDLTCAAKGQAMMHSWYNAENNDHMMPGGKINKNCATMCLQGGQPAALFDGSGNGKIVAVFACNPKATLADYAAEDVDVQGFWAGSKKDDTKTFVPQKIRKKGSSQWSEVDCATMHG